MSQVRHIGSLPTPEDIESLLEAAREAADYCYQGPEYSYVHKALHDLFSNSIECSIECFDNDVDPVEILLESLQDERAVLSRHNQLQAKALVRKEKINDLSEDLINFPLRYLTIKQGIKLPPGLEPIYQLTDDHDTEDVEAAREARANAATTMAQLDASSLRTPTNVSSKASAKNTGFNMGKLYDAPSPEHDFPDGNITLAEIAAFLPQSIKCWDVADRILWNGAATEDIATLINKYRVMPAGDVDNNSVYMMMRGQMRKRCKQEHGYKHWKTWTVGAQTDVEKPADFHPHSISVAGFRRPTIFKSRPDVAADPVPFKDLANGVAVWPQHGDALDLTRIVSWCAANPDEDYYYPTDFQKVLFECLGGPVTPKARHTDVEVLSRLRSTTGTDATKPRRHTNTNYTEDDTDSPQTGTDVQPGKRKRARSSLEERSNRRKNPAEKTARLPRTTHNTTARTASQKSSFNFGNIDSEDDTEDDAYQGPKRAKKNSDGPRRSGRNKTKTVSYADDAMQIDDDEEDEDQEYAEAEDDRDDDDEEMDEMDEDED